MKTALLAPFTQWQFHCICSCSTGNNLLHHNAMCAVRGASSGWGFLINVEVIPATVRKHVLFWGCVGGQNAVLTPPPDVQQQSQFRVVYCRTDSGQVYSESSPSQRCRSDGGLSILVQRVSVCLSGPWLLHCIYRLRLNLQCVPLCLKVLCKLCH